MQQPYDSVIYMGNIGGPINKKASFFFNVQRRNIDEIAVVNAPVLDPNFQPTTLSESVPNPRTRTNLSPRIDYQVTTNNTLTARYQFYRDTQQNAGVGGFVLPEAGYDTTSTEHTLQISDTQILGTKVVNETRFQYLRDNSGQNPLSTALRINVLERSPAEAAVSGAAERSSGSLRTAELHFDSAGQTLREIRRATCAPFTKSACRALDSMARYTFPDLSDLQQRAARFSQRFSAEPVLDQCNASGTCAERSRHGGRCRTLRAG